MRKPKIAAMKPIVTKLEQGEERYWCSCGESKNQPFCDGSHKSTSFEPCTFRAKFTGEVYLCMCKQTKNPPYCDGTHKIISED